MFQDSTEVLGAHGAERFQRSELKDQICTRGCQEQLMTPSPGLDLELQLQKPDKDLETHPPLLLPPSRNPTLTQQPQATFPSDSWPTPTTRRCCPRSLQDALPSESGATRLTHTPQPNSTTLLLIYRVPKEFTSYARKELEKIKLYCSQSYPRLTETQ